MTVIGCQEPRIGVWPEFSSSAGAEACDLAATCGLELDPWQRLSLDVMLGERQDGNWAAMEYGLVVPRQSGKNVVAEARELAGLVLLGERLITHTAHLFPTCLEHFRRMQALIEGNDDVARLVAKVVTSHGAEAIEMRNGARLLFRARSKGAGRGFSGDCIVFDEAFDMLDISAMVPSLSAAGNPQLIYLSTPPVSGPRSDPLRRLMRTGRAAAKAGRSDSLAYLEWSCDAADADPDDLEALRRANPGLGLRLNLEFVTGPERTAMSAAEYQRERLGVWVDHEQEGFGDVPAEAWRLAQVGAGRLGDPVWFALDMTPERDWCSVVACGAWSDGVPAVELVDHRRGSGWVTGRVAQLWESHTSTGVVVDPASPAGSLIPGLEAAGVRVVPCTGRDARAAAGDMFDRLSGGRVWVVQREELTQAASAVAKRWVGEAWVPDRRAGAAPIAPYVAAGLALWGWCSAKPARRRLDAAAYAASVRQEAS